MAWTADAPLDVLVRYRHQYQPRVLLLGTDADHSLGVLWTAGGVDTSSAGIYGSWMLWTDSGRPLTFDAATTGEPPRRTQDQTEFLVDSALDATIRYAAPPPPPPIRESPNWKPALAVVYATTLVVTGYALGSRPIDRWAPPSVRRRGPEAREAFRRLPVNEKVRSIGAEDTAQKVREDRRRTRLMIAVPFASVEAAIGVASLFTGVFRIPEAGSWSPVGFWVNTLLLAGGIVVGLAVHRRGYRPQDLVAASREATQI